MASHEFVGHKCENQSLLKGLEDERDLGMQSSGAGDQGCSGFPMLNSRVPSRIGGSIPIVFSYFSEFLAQEKRGEHLSWLCMFWMIGGVYAAAMAWAIIPHYGEQPLGNAPRTVSLLSRAACGGDPQPVAPLLTL